MLVVSDDTRNEIETTIDKAMELYSNHDFLALAEFETNAFIKRQIDNYHDLESRGLEEVSKNFKVTNLRDAQYVTENNITVRIQAVLEHYIVRKEDEEVIDGIREYLIGVSYLVKLEKNTSDTLKECKYCGAKIELGDQKCPYCGTPINNKNVEWLIADMIEL